MFTSTCEIFLCICIYYIVVPPVQLTVAADNEYGVIAFTPPQLDVRVVLTDQLP